MSIQKANIFVSWIFLPVLSVLTAEDLQEPDKLRLWNGQGHKQAVIVSLHNTSTWITNNARTDYSHRMGGQISRTGWEDRITGQTITY